MNSMHPLAQALTVMALAALIVTWLYCPCRRCPAGRAWKWHFDRRSTGGMEVQVVVADEARRRALERALQTALRRLHHALGSPSPPTTGRLVVVVQQVICTGPGERHLPACRHMAPRPDGHEVLIRLALYVNGRERSIDELLASLTEYYVDLAFGADTAQTMQFETESGPLRSTGTAAATLPAEAPSPSDEGTGAWAVPRQSAWCPAASAAPLPQTPLPQDPLAPFFTTGSTAVPLSSDDVAAPRRTAQQDPVGSPSQSREVPRPSRQPGQPGH